MTTSTIIAIAVVVLVALAGLLLFATARRRDTGAALGQLSHETKTRDRGPVSPTAEVEAGTEARPVTGKEIERAAALERRVGTRLEKAPAATPVPWVPPDAETIGVTRRQFFNRSIVSLFGLGLTSFGGAAIVFLWPSASGGFGSAIRVGKISDIKAKIDEGAGFAYYPEGRMWITAYPSAAVEKAKAVYSPSELSGMEAGVVALYQKCPHLGCRVPQCVTSKWFECPCHGSQYNNVGEKKGGPAPRGMDRFAMTVSGDTLTVDTGTVIQGPPIGTNTTGQEAEGPHCIGGGAEH
jgi:cytochrome b6-f complex iron-sulfur subunit